MIRMNIFSIVFLLIYLICPCSKISAQNILAQAGESEYMIVVSDTANESVLHAADQLQHYLRLISGAELQIINDHSGPVPHEIWVGLSNRLKNSNLDKEFETLEKDAFRVKTFDQKLIIAGAEGKGTLYGVYSFLEDDLGCRYYTPEMQVVPQQTAIKFGAIDRYEIPVFELREIYFPAMKNQAFCDWHKIHSQKEVNKDWGMRVHTFEKLLPPGNYFKDHPEYYSLVNEIRIDDGQLCLSTDTVFRLLIDTLQKKMEARPHSKHWSVSQNDIEKPCECTSCLELDTLYGGPSGTMIWFVNKVARMFPEKIISTLAYQYTRSAPENIRPEKNVNIMLCSIECNRSQPIADDTSSADFRQDLEDWSQLTDDLLLWDYIVQFRNYISPFPNLHVLQPNIQYFAANHINKMFQQGSGKDISEFYELRTYLISKLLWNPDLDVDVLMDDFLNGYYGDAAPYLRQYIDFMHKKLRKSGDELDIFGYPYAGVDTYLKPKFIKRYQEYFDDAEVAVADDSVLLTRVQLARLPLEFIILDFSLRQINEELSYFSYTNDTWELKTEMVERLHSFVDAANQAGIGRLMENGKSPDKFLKRVREFLSLSFRENYALLKPVTEISNFSTKYNPAGEKALTDGLAGLPDFNYNWLGFKGEHLDAVIDLGTEASIHSIRSRFMQNQYSHIFFPEFVEYYVSSDGKNFTSVDKVKNHVAPRKDGLLTDVFQADELNITGRYVKVHAENLLECPVWHVGAGEPCWIFIDEIIVD